MQIRSQLLVIAGTIGLAACASTRTSEDVAAPADRDMAAPRVATAADMREGVFEVRLTNPTQAAVCVAEGDWPSSDFMGKEATPSGSLHMASGRVYAVVGTERFPIEEENLGYCDPSVPDLEDGHACQIVVGPGATRQAVIPFARFRGLVQASTEGTPRLVYDPAITMCDD
jgi:hypothetical protein